MILEIWPGNLMITLCTTLPNGIQGHLKVTPENKNEINVFGREMKIAYS